MSHIRLHFYARRDNFFGDTIGITISAKVSENAVAIAQPPVMKTHPSHETIFEPDPTLKLHRDDAQALMDELWHVGIRPTEGTGSAGSLAATERHLADMRELVFKRTMK